MSDRRIELTFRGVLLGVLITFAFTAANVYMGLKVALTFASSIPAAVISMALLRGFKDSTIWENNIVQTVASAAGTLSSVIFVLPGLVMIGWWSGIPFWQTFGICALGGVLGVMYTIPLRRALVTNSTLPYPEGVAGAEVLKVGAANRGEESSAEGKAGVAIMGVGALAAAGFSGAIGAKFIGGAFTRFFRPTAASATGFGGSFSLALAGAGHLMGIGTGLSMLFGVFLAWGVLVPIMTGMAPVPGAAEAAAMDVWRSQVRLIGAGAIAAAAIWTLGKLAGPVVKGLGSAIAASRKAQAGEVLDRTEQDLPIWIVGLITLVTLVPIAFLLHGFLGEDASAPLSKVAVPLLIGGLAYIVIAGFLVAAVCGYMAGLIGSSNSPVSGLAILSVLGASLLLVAVAKTTVGPEGWPALVAFALFVTSVLLAVATIANDNLQDLKTGQLVGATPRAQQIALLIGVFAGALVIPPTLNLLTTAYGFVGANAHAISNEPLAAPQATLISTLAKGVIQGNLPWNLIGIGALVGVGLVIVDEVLRKTGKFFLPPLGAAMAIYLPFDLTASVIVGSVIGWLWNRAAAKSANPERYERFGVLLASGFIVGESLFSVAIAGLTVAVGKDSPLAIFGELPFGEYTGLATFAVLLWVLYGWVSRLAKRTA
jgi:putative OPT family oligopeptide transporter